MDPQSKRRLVTETDQVLAQVAHATGQTVELVVKVIGAFREAIDALLAQGAIVATGELFLSMGDSPTRRALLERLDADVSVPSEVLSGDAYATATWLDLPPSVYDEHPLANRPHVMPLAIEILGDQGPGLPVLWAVLEAWDSTFAGGRKYRVSTVGLEVAAEVWLVEHLPRLRLHGFPVDLAKRQYVLPSGKRLDLLCRFNDSTPDATIGDWLVIELKATGFYPAAAEQLENYLAEIAESAGSKAGVHGLLITDGANHAEVEELRTRGLAHLSLAQLGYRLHLAQENRKLFDSTTADATALTTAQHSHRLTTSSLSASTADPVTAVVDGPEVYWARLFWDQKGNRQSERAVARDLWERRESRRARYEAKWGRERQWPATHPTTILESPGTPWPEVGVCISCDWLVRPPDLGGMDVGAAAKEHALAHSHDLRLEAGINPPRRGLAEVISDARRGKGRSNWRNDEEPGDEEAPAQRLPS